MKRNGPSRRPHYNVSTNKLKNCFCIAQIGVIFCGLMLFTAFVMGVLAAGSTDFMIENCIVDPARQSAVDSLLVSALVLTVLSGLGMYFCKKTANDIARIIRKRMAREAAIRKKIAIENRKSIRKVPAEMLRPLIATALYGKDPSYEKYCYLCGIQS